MDLYFFSPHAAPTVEIAGILRAIWVQTNSSITFSIRRPKIPWAYTHAALRNKEFLYFCVSLGSSMSQAAIISK